MNSKHKKLNQAINNLNGQHLWYRSLQAGQRQVQERIYQIYYNSPYNISFRIISIKIKERNRIKINRGQIRKAQSNRSCININKRKLPYK